MSYCPGHNVVVGVSFRRCLSSGEIEVGTVFDRLVVTVGACDSRKVVRHVGIGSRGIGITPRIFGVTLEAFKIVKAFKDF